MTPYFETRDGAVQIWHGDALDILPTLGPVDHVITDPPYEVEAHTMGRRAGFGGRAETAGSIERPLGFDAIDPETRLSVGAEMARLGRGWILVFCQVEAAMLWRDALAPARYMRTQIWRKVNGAPQFTGDRPGMGYESIVTAWAGEGRSKWNGGGRHGCYDYGTVRENGTGHTTEKPLALMRDLVSLFTDPGDTILDPFAGSGTTGRAALDLGRKAILIEQEERWCEVAAKRMAQGVLL